jgi:hypothetical protein
MAGDVDRDLRASDADREKAVAELRVHHHAGRLDDDELEERVATAYGAKTVGPLYDVLGDLPVVQIGAVAPIVPHVVDERGYGVRAFHQEHELPTDPRTTWEEAISTILPGLMSVGYFVVERSAERGIVLAIEERPWWTWALAVGFFPFGLAALWIKDQERVSLRIEPRRGGGTRLVVHGRARRRVRRTFATLSSG